MKILKIMLLMGLMFNLDSNGSEGSSVLVGPTKTYLFLPVPEITIYVQDMLNRKLRQIKLKFKRGVTTASTLFKKVSEVYDQPVGEIRLMFEGQEIINSDEPLDVALVNNSHISMMLFRISKEGATLLRFNENNLALVEQNLKKAFDFKYVVLLNNNFTEKKDWLRKMLGFNENNLALVEQNLKKAFDFKYVVLLNNNFTEKKDWLRKLLGYQEAVEESEIVSNYPNTKVKIKGVLGHPDKFIDIDYEPGVTTCRQLYESIRNFFVPESTYIIGFENKPKEQSLIIRENDDSICNVRFTDGSEIFVMRVPNPTRV